VGTKVINVRKSTICSINKMNTEYSSSQLDSPITKRVSPEHAREVFEFQKYLWKKSNVIETYGPKSIHTYNQLFCGT
jgi:hypothetical protein